MAEGNGKRAWKLAAVGVAGAVLVFVGGGLLEGPVAAASAKTAGVSQAEEVDIAARLTALGVTLYEPPAPLANYVKTVRTGNLVFLSGHGPSLLDGSGLVTGKLGADLTVDEGYDAARLVGIALLSSLQAELGDLGRVRRVVRVFGMVNATPDFTDHSLVINGASDLLVDVFGDRGKHVRAAVGMASLPRGMAVEIEMIVEVE